MIKTISPKQLIDIFLQAEKAVTSRKSVLNNLNVYPVPDGDTGTNMSLTLKEIVDNIDTDKEYDLDKLADIIAQSSLMGGRGNSGVILSQFLSGFTSKIKDKELINKDILLEAFQEGTSEAYKSVSKPVEGTILTVMHSASEEFEKRKDWDDLLKILKSVINKSQFTLKKTPDMLQKLKEAGVVDAGGAGFVYFLEGFYNALKDDHESGITATDDFSSPPLARIWDESSGIFGTGGLRSVLEFNYKAMKFTLENIWWLFKKFWEVIKMGGGLLSLKKAIRLVNRLAGQLKLQNIRKTNTSIQKLFKVWQEEPDEKFCTEAIIEDVKLDVPSIKQKIEKINGTSAIVAQKNGLTKIHFHTQDKSEAKKLYESLGKVKKFKVDNLHKQHKEFVGKSPKQHSNNSKGVELLAVISGNGFERLYKSFEGVITLDGGDTMNPSVASIKKEIENIECNNIIILPNNKNVFMASQKAAENSDKHIKILKTTDQALGLSCLLNYNPQGNLKENYDMMKSSLDLVQTFSLSKAIRKSTISGKVISKDEYFSISENKLLSRGREIETVILKSLNKITNNKQLVTLYFGSKLSKQDAVKLSNVIKSKFKIEVQVYEGGQKHYYYILSLE